MTRFGDVPITAQQGPQQTYLITVPNVGAGANSSSLFTALTWTLPIAGTVVAEFKVRLNWTAEDVWFRAHLNSSFPAPNYSSNFPQRTGFPGGFRMTREAPLTAVWYNVAAGTTMYFYVNVYVGLSPATIVAIGGLARVTPT